MFKQKGDNCLNIRSDEEARMFKQKGRTCLNIRSASGPNVRFLRIQPAPTKAADDEVKRANTPHRRLGMQLTPLCPHPRLPGPRLQPLPNVKFWARMKRPGCLSKTVRIA